MNIRVPSAIKLSPSALNLFLDCPRCFWYEKVKAIKRPRGIFPSLPSGMDRVIKTYFDKYRAKKSLPPELNQEEFEGIRLFGDQFQLEKWRSWRTGLVYRSRDALLSGALDDLLVKDGKYIPFDYKTKGSVTTLEDAVRYYQNQLDCYALMLEGNEMETAGFGYLIYFSPKAAGEKGAFSFEIQTLKIPTDPSRAQTRLHEAVNLIKGDEPNGRFQCEYCAWLTKRASIRF